SDNHINPPLFSVTLIIAYALEYVNIANEFIVFLIPICYRTQAFVLFFQHTVYNAQKEISSGTHYVPYRFIIFQA
ncbi:hypothetical protein QUC45_18430, partial [Staphylococcus aureus]|uniref:hypothetical protein n=2 Tax=Staphylococcus aureus TaxID=1280 RepID=UPI003524E101